MNILPKAKTANLAVQELKDELLVYNLTTHQAFTLNETLKIVYSVCDGQTSFNELKRKYKFTDDLIHLALDELNSHDLLENYQSTHFGNLSRREAIKKVGLASMVALPVIAAITAPSAASGASAKPDNAICTMGTSGGDTTAECQSGYCLHTQPNGTLRCCTPTPNQPYEQGQSVGAASSQANCNFAASRSCCSTRGTLTNGQCVCS